MSTWINRGCWIVIYYTTIFPALSCNSNDFDFRLLVSLVQYVITPYYYIYLNMKIQTLLQIWIHHFKQGRIASKFKRSLCAGLSLLWTENGLKHSKDTMHRCIKYRQDNAIECTRWNVKHSTIQYNTNKMTWCDTIWSDKIQQSEDRP